MGHIHCVQNHLFAKWVGGSATPWEDGRRSSPETASLFFLAHFIQIIEAHGAGCIQNGTQIDNGHASTRKTRSVLTDLSAYLFDLALLASARSQLSIAFWSLRLARRTPVQWQMLRFAGPRGPLRPCLGSRELHLLGVRLLLEPFGTQDLGVPACVSPGFAARHAGRSSLCPTSATHVGCVWLH